MSEHHADEDPATDFRHAVVDGISDLADALGPLHSTLHDILEELKKANETLERIEMGVT